MIFLITIILKFFILAKIIYLHLFIYLLSNHIFFIIFLAENYMKCMAKNIYILFILQKIQIMIVINYLKNYYY